MTRYLTVRLAPIMSTGKATATPNRVTKKLIREWLADGDTLVAFRAVDGGYLTIPEARREGVDVLELRYNGDRDVAMVNVATGRVS